MGVLRDKMVQLKVNGKFYRSVVRLAMMYGRGEEEEETDLRKTRVDVLGKRC